MNGKKTIELSMKEFIIALLRKWLVVLCCAILVAGTFGLKTYMQNSRNIDELNRRYEMDLRAYEQNIQAKQISINDLIRKNEAANEYMTDSLLMQADPYHKRTADLAFSVMAIQPDEARLPSNELKSMNMNISNMYFNVINTANLSQIFGELIDNEYSAYKGISEAYLKEIVVSSKTPSEDMINLSVIGNENMNPVPFAEALYQYLQGEQERISSLIFPHQLIQLGSALDNISSDNDLAQLQSEKRSEIAAVYTQINELEAELSAIRAAGPVVPGKLNGVIKSALIPFVVVAILVALIIMLVYAIQLQIQSSDQVQSQFGVRYLGGGLQKRGQLFGRWGDKLSGVDRLASDADVKALVRANIKEAVCGNYQQVLLTGTVSQAIIETFLKEISEICSDQGTQFVCARDLANSAAAVELLEKSQAVIFVERVGLSKMKLVYQNIERARQSNKEIVGYTLA